MKKNTAPYGADEGGALPIRWLFIHSFIHSFIGAVDGVITDPLRRGGLSFWRLFI